VREKRSYDASPGQKTSASPVTMSPSLPVTVATTGEPQPSCGRTLSFQPKMPSALTSAVPCRPAGSIWILTVLPGGKFEPNTPIEVKLPP
jgi:hypothetical protein